MAAETIARRLGVARGAAHHPDRPAVVDEFGSRFTYTELDDLVNRTVHALEDLGLAPGDVFCLLTENRAQTLALHHVAYRGGFRFTPLNPRSTREEVAYVLEDSEARVLFADVEHRRFAAEVVDTVASRPITVVVGGSGRGSFEELVGGRAADRVAPRFGSVMAYTSGTTGRPKAVVRDRVRPSPEALEAMMQFGRRLGYDPEHDRHLTTAPLYHGGPLISAMHTINLGGTVHLMRRFDAERTLELIEQKRITSVYMVPTMYHRLLRLPDERREQADTSSLRSVMHTGAPCPPALKQEMIDWLGPIVYECYAATEGQGTYTVCTSEQWLEHPGTVGRPEHDVITIRDDDGNELPPGEVGHIYARTLPGVAEFEYKDDPEKTAAAYNEHGEYTVGDMGYLDEDGFLYVTGRATDMIITGGVNVYPPEVERVLLRHELVADVAVLGVPDEEWGERVAAAVQAVPDAPARHVVRRQVDAFAREHVADHKRPRVIHVVEDLGRDPSGKLRKRELRERLDDATPPGGAPS